MKLSLLHELMGIDVAPIIEPGGRASRTAFLARGIYVRVACLLVALATLLFGRKRFRGVMIIGRDDAEHARAPVVLLDFETYSRLLVGLRAQPLPDVGMAGSASELAEVEAERAERGEA